MKKPKVGLCVCYDTKNFGSQLQVLATLEKVKEFGYDYEIIRYKKKLTPAFALQSIPRLFNSSFVMGKIKTMKKKRLLKQHAEIWRNVQIRNRRFDQFVQEHFLCLSAPYNGYDELKKGTANYDMFLTGSDQLWLPANLGSHFYTQEFVPDDKRKIAYAPSFGVSQIPWYQKNRTKKYLNRFAFLSTRETAGQKIIREMTGKEAQVVADPTLLLTPAQWAELLPECSVVEGKYIFCYLLGTNPEHRAIASELREKTGLPLVTIPFLDHFVEADQSFGDQQLFNVNSADFVNLIRNAEYVLTDSFHGSVFSILHHKQFLTLNRFSDASKNSRNSRIDSLCSHLGLENRRFSGDVMKITEPIDYETVDAKREQMREVSIRFLKDSLY